MASNQPQSSEEFGFKEQIFLDQETESIKQFQIFACGYTSPSDKYVMNANALWNQEAINLVHIDGSIFKKTHMSLRQPMLSSLYDITIQKLRAENLQMPFRLFHIKIGRLRQLGLEKCVEDMRQIIIEHIHKKYPGPIMLSSYSTGGTYALNVLPKLNLPIKNLIMIAPTINFSKKQSPWQLNIQNREYLLEKAKKDKFLQVISKFMREEIIGKQYPNIEDKVTPEDPRLSQIFCTKEQYEHFKQVAFSFFLADQDGMLLQQLAFKDMLDSYKIQNTVEIFQNRDHGIAFFKFFNEYPQEKVNKLLNNKMPFLEKMRDKLFEVARSYNLVTQLSVKNS